MGAILNVYHYQKSQKMVIKMADNMKANQKWWPKVSSTWTRILNVFQWLVHYDHRWVQCYPTSHQSEIVHSSIYFWWKIQCTFRASARNAPWCHNRPLETFGGCGTAEPYLDLVFFPDIAMNEVRLAWSRGVQLHRQLLSFIIWKSQEVYRS